MVDIVICEKPSQAKNISAAVGTKYGKVVPAQGHLIALAEPEEVRDEWKIWGTDVLWPGKKYPLRANRADGKGARLDTIKSALAEVSKSKGRVIIATDCDREGQLIGEEILEFFKFKGPVFRAMFPAEDPVTLKDAFAKIKPNKEYYDLGQAAVARQQADQVYNLTLTRCATVSLRGEGGKGAIGVGRVKTATLAILCIRELEIRNFKPETYYAIDADVAAQGGRSAWLSHNPREEERITDKSVADAIRKAVESYRGAIAVDVERDKRQGPPPLPDLPEMQKWGGSRGWSAQKVLDVAQSLYDRHIITYPRAEAKYLAENQISVVDPLLDSLSTLDFIDKVAPEKAVIRKGTKGHFSDAGLKGTAHHAVIPNPNCPEDFVNAWKGMSADERELFDFVARRFVAAVSPDHIFDATSLAITVKVEGKEREFTASGRVTTSAGWKAVMGGDKDGDAEDSVGGGEQSLPNFEDGEKVSVREARLDNKVTKPPKRYNEGSLVIAMQNAWQFVKDPALANVLKGCKGIGTPATRAGIIETMKRQKQVAIVKNNIVPTESGMQLYQVLAAAAPELVDPGTTAMWEIRLDDVALGRRTSESVILDIVKETERLARIVAGQKGKVAIAGEKRKPNDGMIRAAEAVARNRKVQLPAGYKTDFGVCRAFLDRFPREQDEARSPGAPSEGSISFARTIAEDKGIDVPQEALKSQAALSRWIEENKSGKGGKPSGSGTRQKFRRRA